LINRTNVPLTFYRNTELAIHFGVNIYVLTDGNLLQVNTYQI